MINVWPSAFLPSTFEDAEDRVFKFAAKCRDRVENPVKTLVALDKKTREGPIKSRILGDTYIEAARDVLSAPSKAEALRVLDGYGYLQPPKNKKTGEVIPNPAPHRSIGATPHQLVKAAHRAATTAPIWLPAWLTRGVMIDHVIDLTRTDELLRQHLGDMTKSELEVAAMERGLPGPHLDEPTLRRELTSWLALIDGEEAPADEAARKKRRRRSGATEPLALPVRAVVVVRKCVLGAYLMQQWVTHRTFPLTRLLIRVDIAP